MKKLSMKKELFNEFIKNRMASNLSENTITSYCYALKDYYQWLTQNNVTQVTPTVIQDYFIYLRGKGYSMATMRDKYAVINAFYNYLVNNKYIRENPVKIKKPPLPTRRARCFTEAELTTIMDYFADSDDSFTKLRDKTIVSILLATGLRRSELLNITSCSGDVITVIGKGRKQRTVPVSDSLRAVLDKYIVERNKRAVCPFLIITRDGKKMTVNGLRAVFTRLSQNTGIGGKRFSAHTFRHTFATQFLKNGGNIVTLQKLLAHSDLSTTAIYLHYDDDAIKKENNLVNPLNIFLFHNFFT